MSLQDKYDLLVPLAISRLNALKSQPKTPKSTKPRSKQYQQGVSDSLWVLTDLFENLSIKKSNK